MLFRSCSSVGGFKTADPWMGSIAFVLQCVANCYPPHGGQPDPKRAMNVVTSLTWVVARLITSHPDPEEMLREFEREVNESHLPEMRADLRQGGKGLFQC